MIIKLLTVTSKPAGPVARGLHTYHYSYIDESGEEKRGSFTNENCKIEVKLPQKGRKYWLLEDEPIFGQCVLRTIPFNVRDCVFKKGNVPANKGVSKKLSRSVR